METPVQSTRTEFLALSTTSRQCPKVTQLPFHHGRPRCAFIQSSGCGRSTYGRVEIPVSLWVVLSLQPQPKIMPVRTENVGKKSYNYTHTCIHSFLPTDLNIVLILFTCVELYDVYILLTMNWRFCTFSSFSLCWLNCMSCLFIIINTEFF